MFIKYVNFSQEMRDKKAWLLLTNRSMSLVLVFHLFIEQIIVMAVMSNFVLVNDLFALSLRFSDDEDLLQREREEVLESWKAGVL